MKICYHDAASNGAVFRASLADEDAAKVALEEHFVIDAMTVTRDYVAWKCTEKVPATLSTAIAAVGARPLPQKFT